MSVTRGSSAEEFEPVMNFQGEAARIVSGPGIQRINIDHANETGGELFTEEDAGAFFPFLNRFDDKGVGVIGVEVHVEANNQVDFMATELYINELVKTQRTAGEFSTPIANDANEEWLFYTGASALDAGAADTGNQGDGHQYEERWESPVINDQFMWQAQIDEDDSIGLKTTADTNGNRVSAGWMLDYVVLEYVD